MIKFGDKNLNTPENWSKDFLKKGKKIDDSDISRLVVMARFFNGGRFIDIGCYNSSLPNYIKTNFQSSEVWGLDFNPVLIKHFKKKYPEINYICSDVLKMPFEDNYFDYAVCGEVIEHMDEPEKLVREIYRIIKPEGIFSISTPFEEKRWSGETASWHIWSFAPRDMGELLKPYGLFKLQILFAAGCPKILAYCKK